MRHIRIQEGTVNRFTKIILKLFKHSHICDIIQDNFLIQIL